MFWGSALIWINRSNVDPEIACNDNDDDDHANNVKNAHFPALLMRLRIRAAAPR
jgi:hypothetical protein